MKAILVIDMPNRCEECPCFSITTYCGVRNEVPTDFIYSKPTWCPLKPMPSKRISAVEWLNGIKTHEISEYDKGWNDCVEMLEGEDYE